MPNNATMGLGGSRSWRRRAKDYANRPGVTRPSWSGTQSAGLTLTAATGNWAPAGSTFEYQWYRDRWPIPGAEASTYVVTAGDVGHLIQVCVAAVGTSHGPLCMFS
jgi:hypothetical protein